MSCLRTCLVIFLILFNSGLTLAQNTFKEDLALIGQQDFKKKVNVQHSRSFFFLSDKKFFKYNPVSLAFGGLMYVYQNVISSQISADCPYEISCSGFSRQVIRKYGILKGLALSSDRVTRCTKMSAQDLNQLDFNEQGKIIDDPAEYKLK